MTLDPLANPLPSLDEIEWRVCTAIGVVQTELPSAGRGRKLAQARGIIGRLAMQYGLDSLREVAEHYHRDAWTLTVAVPDHDGSPNCKANSCAW